MSRVITLTTDFGLNDAYVAAMKGVLLSMKGLVPIIDIRPQHNRRELRRIQTEEDLTGKTE